MPVRFFCNTITETQVKGEIVFEDAPLVSGVEGFKRDLSSWGKKGNVWLVPLAGGGTAGYQAFLGAGKRAGFTDSVLRDITAEYVRFCTSQSLSHLSLSLSSSLLSSLLSSLSLNPSADGSHGNFTAAASSAVAEGACAGTYRFDKYLEEKRKSEISKLETFVLVGGNEAGLERGKIIGLANSYAKDLCNEPGNVVNPVSFAMVAQKLADRCGLDCSISDEHEIADAGMKALWYVGIGSATPPRLVHLVYRPAERAHKRIAIIGKGVTFDSGGLCIKTREGIKTMKHDKSGACVMLGVMKAVAELRLPVEVHGIAGVVENMPDGAAYRPDDIIRAMNGKTIEISSTDAEGRLTLADVLTLASKLEPDAIVDVATLTGAAVTALGKYTAALLCDDDDLSAALEKASKIAGERLHRFVMDDSYLLAGLRAVHADLRQGSPDGGGTISAGMFLREFVEPSIPWAHVDIASTGWYDKEFDVYSKGASAYALRTIVEYLSSL